MKISAVQISLRYGKQPPLTGETTDTHIHLARRDISRSII